jgi:hypothetical protein
MAAPSAGMNNPGTSSSSKSARYSMRFPKSTLIPRC